jgi:hypothetical protein
MNQKIKRKVSAADIIGYMKKDDLSFTTAAIMINFDEDDKRLLEKSYKHRLGKISFNYCDVFLSGLESLNDLLECRHQISLTGCNVYIDQTTFVYSVDAVEQLNKILYDEEGKLNKVVILNFNVVFQYYPQDFIRFSEVVKKIKMDKLNFNFNYSDRTKENERKPVPLLHEFNNVLKSLVISNAVLNKSMFPYTEDLFLRRCNGEFFSMSNEIHLEDCNINRMKFFTGTSVYFEEGTYARLSCNGKFNVYFDSPSDYTKENIEILSGSIKHTNKKDLLDIKPTIYKYQVFINQDFSDQIQITQYYHCKFFNCYFNSNQFILDSEFTKCFFSEGKRYVKYS